jgi:hypothetical protein
MRALKLTMLLAGLFGAQAAVSSPIFYEVESLGGNTYRYNYTVGNEIGEPIDWFTIWFDPELYWFDFDAVAGGPAGWDVFVAPPEFLFPGDPDNQYGLFDACGFFDDFLPCDGAAAILPGELIGGFSIVFDWLGAIGTMPGSQPFTLFGDDLPDNPLLFTQPLASVAVSEPATLGLFGSALLMLGLMRRRAYEVRSTRLA